MVRVHLIVTAALCCSVARSTPSPTPAGILSSIIGNILTAEQISQPLGGARLSVETVPLAPVDDATKVADARKPQGDIEEREHQAEEAEVIRAEEQAADAATKATEPTADGSDEVKALTPRFPPHKVRFCDLPWRASERRPRLPAGALTAWLAHRVAATTSSRARDAIYMIGDSTMRQQFESMCEAIRELAPLTFMSSDVQLELRPEHHGDNMESMLHVCHGMMVDARGDGSVLEIFIAFQGKNGGSWFRRYEGAKWRTAYPPLPLPTTVYVTGGLHLLHLAYGNDKSRMEFQLPFATFRTREVINNFLDAVTHETPHAEIVVMTMPAICEDKMTKFMEKEINLYKNMPNVFCAEFKKQYRLERQNVWTSLTSTPTEIDLQLMCMETSFTRQGAKALNERVISALDNWIDRHPHQGSRVAVLDFFRLTDEGCEYTRRGDAIHFPPLNPAALVTLLMCLDDVATGTPIEKSSGDTLARKKRKLEAKAAHAARVRDAIDSDSAASGIGRAHV